MRRSAGLKAFTLMELLMSTAVLALIVVLAAQMTSATISTASYTAQRLDGSEGMRTTLRMLRDELSGVIASQREERYLNLMVREDESGVALYFTVPQPKTNELSRQGFVNHVAYVWDRNSRTFSRAEYHSSREADTVRATARTADGTDMSANLKRIREITPAYQGKSPYAWVSQTFREELLKQARRNPLLTGVDDWTVECMTSNVVESGKVVKNEWDKPDQLPVALRVTFTLDTQRRFGSSGDKLGRRYTGLIPLICAEAAQ